ncbi:MAG: recombinase family protein [Elusimicrobia bacterium]|nr:recombinase family protein [Elusimicrobiota bacterium]
MINKINNTNNNNNAEKAVLFLRVSSKGQEDNYSLDAQEKLATKYAQEHNLKIIKIWKVAESAWGKKERKNFMEMLEYVKKHIDIKHILFDILDRMTRNDMDKIKIKDLIHFHDKTIHFTRTNKIYNKNTSPDDEFMLDIETAVAKKMSNDISRKTKMGLDEKAAEGYYPANAPIGYKNAKDNEGKNIIIVDNERAPFIKELFEKIATGSYSIEMMVSELHRAGLRSKKDGGSVVKSSLYRILQNPFYYGVFRWKGKIYKGKHINLISEELWLKANEALKKSSRPHISKHNFAFTNLLICDTCGCTILGEIQKGRYIYYRCSHTKNKHKIKEYIPENDLANKFGNIIKAISIPKNVGDMIKEGIELIAKNKDAITENRVSVLKKNLIKSKIDLKKLYESEFNDLNITETKKQFYKDKENELLSNITASEEELNKIGNSKDVVLNKNEEIIELLTNLNKLYEICDNYEKAKIIKFILELSKLSKNNEIIPTYRKPFNYFCNINSAINNNSNDNNNKFVEKRNDIGVKTDVVLNHFSIDNSMTFFKSSNICLTGE